MPLTRLIYASRPVGELSPDDVGQILDTSRKNNIEDGITGMLCFDRFFFFQCLEGAREPVNKTYHRIAQDSRHSNVLLISYGEVESRMFADWTMGYLSLDDNTKKALFRYHASIEFNPYKISSSSAECMMRSLSESLSSV